jgi:hypothetical protein
MYKIILVCVIILPCVAEIRELNYAGKRRTEIAEEKFLRKVAGHTSPDTVINQTF